MNGALEGNTNITTNRTTIKKKTKIGLQCYFNNYRNHTLLPVVSYEKMSVKQVIQTCFFMFESLLISNYLSDSKQLRITMYLIYKLE